jgi:hypothetical protein
MWKDATKQSNKPPSHKGLQTNGTYQLLVYTNDINSHKKNKQQ